MQGVNVEVKAKHGANIYVSTGDVFAALLWKVRVCVHVAVQTSDGIL